MRSLQLKFSALVVALLLGACVGLAWIATQHERGALGAEVAKRGISLVGSLASSAGEPLLAGDDLTLGALVQQAQRSEGVVSARILDRNGVVASTLDESERGARRPRLALGSAANPRRPTVLEAGHFLIASTPIVFADTTIGEAQVELDLRLLVDPVVRDSRRQLATVAAAVILAGVGAGLVFVAFLAGPLRRLRAGVERLTRGDLAVRVPPTSLDEVGELTRAFNEMGEALQQKERIQSAFGRYVSDYVLAQLIESPEGEEVAGTEREVTVVFADIRGFTRISEGMKAHDVVALLNEILQLLSDRVLARGGTIDKFMGDAVMAYFGAPVAQDDHALRAVAVAEDCLRAIAERNARILAAPKVGAAGVRVEIGIGIHTGSVVVGNIGSDRRTDFTAVGDAVNVAQRLEKLARPSEILVSEAVQRRTRSAFRMRFEGERQLPGRREPVHVYAVELDGIEPSPRAEEVSFA